MRPESIRQFEYFYLGSIGVAVVNLVLIVTQIGTSFAAMGGLPALSEPGTQTGMTVAAVLMILVGLLFAAILPLILWYFAARRASEVAKWLIVGLGAFSAVRLLLLIYLLGYLIVTHAPTPSFVQWTMMISIVCEVLHMGAIAFLFPADAREWFAKRGIGIREHEEIFG